MRVSVIICTWNRSALLDQTLIRRIRANSQLVSEKRLPYGADMAIRKKAFTFR
jgi:hypothetical protein